MKIMQNHFLLTCAPQQLHGPFSSTQSNSSNSFQCSHTHKIDHGNNEFKIIDMISIFAFKPLLFSSFILVFLGRAELFQHAAIICAVNIFLS